MRSYNEHQFVDYVGEAIKSQPSYHWVITDLRFDNEYLAMRNIGAKIIKVVNNRVQTKDMHITERGFDDKLVDIILPNHGDIGELKSTVNDILERVVKVNETWTNV
jgi:hypothetical protein